MRLRLVGVDSHDEEGLEISQFPAVIGRSQESQLLLDDRWVSRQHCRIELEQGRISVRDLQSRHGTYLNGKPVNEEELRSGDVLTIGLSRFVARFEEPACTV